MSEKDSIKKEMSLDEASIMVKNLIIAHYTKNDLKFADLTLEYLQKLKDGSKRIQGLMDAMTDVMNEISQHIGSMKESE